MYVALFSWYVPVWIAAFSLLVAYAYIIYVLRRKVRGQFYSSCHGLTCLLVVKHIQWRAFSFSKELQSGQRHVLGKALIGQSGASTFITINL